MQSYQCLVKGHCTSTKQAADGATSNFPDSVHNMRQIEFCPHDLKFDSSGAPQNEAHGLILNKFQGVKLCRTKLYQNRGSIINEGPDDRKVKHPEDRDADSKAPVSQNLKRS